MNDTFFTKIPGASAFNDIFGQAPTSVTPAPAAIIAPPPAQCPVTKPQ